MLLSSSRTSRVLRYIDLSDGNVYFSFDVDFFCPLSPIRPLPGLTIRVTLQVSYKRNELLTLHEHYGKPSVLGRVRVAHHISLLLCEWSFCLFLCLVCLSSVSCSILDCPFGFSKRLPRRYNSLTYH